MTVAILNSGPLSPRQVLLDALNRADEIGSLAVVWISPDGGSYTMSNSDMRPSELNMCGDVLKDRAMRVMRGEEG